MTTDELSELWPYVLTLLPTDLSASAAGREALVRARKVPDAEALLRVILAYAVSDLSFKDVAAWARASGIADVTGPAVFYRVREAADWLAALLADVLQPDIASTAGIGQRLRIVDATSISGPGATGTDWRVHALVDPTVGGLASVEVTDASGGETLSRYRLAPGDIVLGDRGYSHATGIYAAVAAGADIVVRVNPHSIRICDARREVINPLESEASVGPTGVMVMDIRIPIPPERTRSRRTWPLSNARAWVFARLLAARTRNDDVVWVVTTLPAEAATPAQVMDLYRLRWQVELVFKRLKSLLDLDALPSRHGGPTARSWIYARLLAAAIAQKLAPPAGDFPPWGYRLR